MVIAVALLISWIVAVLFAPLLGVTLLPRALPDHKKQKGWFARGFQRILLVAMRARWITIGLTVIAFGISIYGLGHVQQQFFPSSDRPELIVDFTLPQNASIAETNRQMQKFEQDMLANNPDVDHWSVYVGQGAPRFILSFDVETPDPSFGQVVVVTKGLDVRDRTRAQLQDCLLYTSDAADE